MNVVEIDSEGLSKLPKVGKEKVWQVLSKILKTKFKNHSIINKDINIEIAFNGSSYRELLHKLGHHKILCLLQLEEIIANGIYKSEEFPKIEKDYVDKVYNFSTIVKIEKLFYNYDFKVFKMKKIGHYMYSGHLDIKKPLES